MRMRERRAIELVVTQKRVVRHMSISGYVMMVSLYFWRDSCL